jgi:hypothetical protein
VEVKIPKRWIEVADEFERTGFELTVVGAGRPTKHGVGLQTLTVTIEVRSEVGPLHFSDAAVDALARKVAELLKAAAERARESQRTEVTDTDICA